MVEAGVDVDFPAVYRALAPLDALIQSAGRCNREGKLVSDDGGPGGLVVIFRPADQKAGNLPYGGLAINLTIEVLVRVADDPSRLATDPALYAEYHEKLLVLDPSDVRERLPGGQLGTSIQMERKSLNFVKVADRAKVIEDSGQAVVVPYCGAIPKLALLRDRKDQSKAKFRLFRDDLRDLQRFMVNLREADIKALGALVWPIADDDGPWQLDANAYDKRFRSENRRASTRGFRRLRRLKETNPRRHLLMPPGY